MQIQFTYLTRDHRTMAYDYDHFRQELKPQHPCERGHSHGQWSRSKSPVSRSQKKLQFNFEQLLTELSCIFAAMEEKDLKQTAREKAVSIEEQYVVNHVESGLPRWLIEAAFVCYLLQAVINWAPLLNWMNDVHLSWVRGIVQTFGAVVMYVGLMRGMKSLYRPFKVWWWIVIVLNLAGFVTELFPAIMYSVGLPVAVSLMLVYLPLGSLIIFNYRGRLRQVGLWMVLYILISSIIPIVSFLLVGPDSGLANLPMEIPTIAVIVVYAWVQRRVLI